MNRYACIPHRWKDVMEFSKGETESGRRRYVYGKKGGWDHNYIGVVNVEVPV